MSNNTKKKIHRIYSKDVSFISDLFKLEVATLKRNTTYREDKPKFDHVEHCHFFRTFDSTGKPMTHCQAVGGHKHKVTIKEVNGRLEAECGPQEGIRESYQDNHTHKTTYIRSEELKPAKLNPEAYAEFEKLNAIPESDGMRIN